jgi:hypothetical protein
MTASLWVFGLGNRAYRVSPIPPQVRWRRREGRPGIPVRSNPARDLRYQRLGRLGTRYGDRDAPAGGWTAEVERAGRGRSEFGGPVGLHQWLSGGGRALGRLTSCWPTDTPQSPPIGLAWCLSRGYSSACGGIAPAPENCKTSTTGSTPVGASRDPDTTKPQGTAALCFLSTRHCALSTRHQALGTRYSLPTPPDPAPPPPPPTRTRPTSACSPAATLAKPPAARWLWPAPSLVPLAASARPSMFRAVS